MHALQQILFFAILATMGGRFSTAGLRPRDQFGAWAEEVDRRFGATLAANGRTDSLDGSMETQLVGSMAVSEICCSPILVTRSERDISRAHMDVFTLGLLLEGNGVIAQRGREARFGPGDLILSDARAPYRIRFDAPVRQLVMTLDRRRLEARLPHAERRTAIRVDGNSGAARVAAAYFAALRAEVPRLGIAEEALGECALDLSALAFGGDSLAPGPAGDGERRLLLDRIKAFIEAELKNPLLTPDYVANRHGISRRYLYGLFESERVSVSGYIWGRRLSHCHDMLADPKALERNISEIAFEWGFNDASHFTRAFRRAFGTSPRLFRRVRSRNG
jgi:AraC family transcriptional regulator, positive regulator of tynA and feaB